MAAVITFVFICFGLAAADVAHLTNSYLPPSRLVAASPEFTSSRTASFTAGSGYSDRLVQAAPVTTYIAPVSTVRSYSERLVQAAPSRSYIAPATFTSTNVVSGYSAPARLTAPATQTFIAPATRTITTQNYVAPATQRFVATAPSAAFTAQKFTSARLTAPSREYLTPEVETFEPIVQQSYTAPAVTYNAPATSAAFTSGVDTQYSADGGYVY